MKKKLSLIKGRWSEYIALVIFALGSGMILLLQLYFHEIYHYSATQASIILAAAGGGQLIGSFFANSYLNKVKRLICILKIDTVSATRLSLLILAILTCFLFILFSINFTYLIFILLACLLGICLSLFYPIVQAVLFENLDISQTVIASSLRRWAINLGVAISLTLISVVTHYPKVLFLSMASLIALTAVLFLFKLKTKSVFDVDNKAVKTNGSFHIIPSKTIILWGIGVFIGTAIFFQTISIYPMFLHNQYGIGTSLFSRLMLINVFMVLGFQFITPYIEKRMSIHSIAALGLVIMGIGISVIVISSFWIVILSFILWSIGEILYMGVVPVYTKIFSRDDQLKSLQYLSFYFFLFYLGKMLGPIMGSFIYDTLQDKTIPMLGILAFAIIGTIPFITLSRNLKSKND